MFLGVLTTSSAVCVSHVAQGMVLDDWSGMHPYYRIFQLPFFVVAGCLVGGVSVVVGQAL